jgi:two-component system chemotaxis sensor kinase CheA
VAEHEREHDHEAEHDHDHDHDHDHEHDHEHDHAENAASLRSVSQTVRVDIRKLDALMNIVGELALARAGINGILDRLKSDPSQSELAQALHRESRALERKMAELQAGILEVRMVPLGQIFDKLSRVVRKISREAQKEIRFLISGADTELDKLIVEELSDPLMHIIRNSIDHGIEPPAERQAAGKPETGTIAITAYHRGNHVVIDVEDDGHGIDTDGILRAALARRVISPEAAGELDRREVYNLIFLPGVSTKEKADEISGRGVGMDVVKTNIARLSGIIDLSSEPGQGTRLSITLPITLAIIPALIIRAAGRTYAIPLNSVLESVLIDPKELKTIERREVYSLRGQTLPLLRLEEVFQLPPLPAAAPAMTPPTASPALVASAPAPGRQYIVVVGLAQHRLGLVADELTGQQDIVIKSLGRALSQIPGIAGATELGGQQTVLVLDIAALVEEAVTLAGEVAA